jgi:hypothetical protein
MTPHPGPLPKGRGRKSEGGSWSHRLSVVPQGRLAGIYWCRLFPAPDFYPRQLFQGPNYRGMVLLTLSAGPG